MTGGFGYFLIEGGEESCPPQSSYNGKPCKEIDVELMNIENVLSGL